MRGEGLTRAANNEQAEFIIDGSDASRGLPSLITNFDTICCKFQLFVTRI